MSNTCVPLARLIHRKLAIGLLVALLLCGSILALASCGTSAGLQGTIASLNVAASSFVVTPQQNAAGVTSLTVTVSPQTEFRGSLHSFSDLTVGMLVKLQGSAQTSTATFVATEIEDEHEADDQENQHNGNHEGSQFKGTVDSVDSAHASFVLKLTDGTTKTVTVSAQTEFEGGLHSLTDLAKGTQVSVKGTLQADGSIAASSVDAENENENEPVEANEVELTGTINSLDSAHASFVLKLGDGTTKTVVTNAQTEFDGGFHGFADLKTGMAVEVRGATQTSGSLLATRVHREDSGDDHDGSGGSDGHDGSGSGSGSGDGGH